MSKAPAFQYYPKDALADTAHLTTEQFGAYWRLVSYAWIGIAGAEQCHLPPDERALAALAGVSFARWRKGIGSAVLPLFEALPDGGWRSKRLSKELRIQQGRSASAKAAAEVRWGSSGSDADAMPEACADDANASPRHHSRMASASPQQCSSSASATAEEPPTPTPPPGAARAPVSGEWQVGPEHPEIPPPLRTDRFRKAWQRWLTYRRSAKGKRRPVSPIAAREQLAKLAAVGPERACAAITEAIANDWQGLFPFAGASPRETPPSPIRPAPKGDGRTAENDLGMRRAWGRVQIYDREELLGEVLCASLATDVEAAATLDAVDAVVEKAKAAVRQRRTG